MSQEKIENPLIHEINPEPFTEALPNESSTESGTDHAEEYKTGSSSNEDETSSTANIDGDPRLRDTLIYQSKDILALLEAEDYPYLGEISGAFHTSISDHDGDEKRKMKYALIFDVGDEQVLLVANVDKNIYANVPLTNIVVKEKFGLFLVEITSTHTLFALSQWQYSGTVFNRCWEQLEEIGCAVEAYSSKNNKCMYLAFTDFDPDIIYEHNAWSYTLDKQMVYSVYSLTAFVGVPESISTFRFPVPATIAEVNNIYECLKTILNNDCIFKGNQYLSNLVIEFFGSYKNDIDNCVDVSNERRKFGYIPLVKKVGCTEFIDHTTLPCVQFEEKNDFECMFWEMKPWPGLHLTAGPDAIL